MAGIAGVFGVMVIPGIVAVSRLYNRVDRLETRLSMGETAVEKRFTGVEAEQRQLTTQQATQDNGIQRVLIEIAKLETKIDMMAASK